MSKKDKFKVEGSLVSRSRALKEKQNNREQSPNEVERTNGLKNVAGLAVESVLVVRLICRSSLRDNLTEGECLDQPEAEFLSHNGLMKSNLSTGEARVTIVQLICRSSLRDNLTEGECLDQPEAKFLSRNWLMKSNLPSGEARETNVQLVCRSSLRDNLTEGERLDQSEAEILSCIRLMKSNHRLAREEAHTNNRPWLGQNKIHDIVVTRITSWLKNDGDAGRGERDCTSGGAGRGGSGCSIGGDGRGGSDCTSGGAGRGGSGPSMNGAGQRGSVLGAGLDGKDLCVR